MSKTMNTFETFIEDKSNQFALAASKAVTINPSEYYNPLWIYGPSGCGKSHLLCSIYHKLSENQENSVLYLSARDLAESLVDLVANRPTLWGHIEQVSVLLVDNMELLCGCKATQIEIAKLFIEKTKNNQQVVCASACPPKKLLPLLKVLQKDGEKALIADIQRPEMKLRSDFVHRYLSDESMIITEEAADYLSRHLTSIPRIKGVMNRAKFHYMQHNKPIALATIKKLILFGGL